MTISEENYIKVIYHLSLVSPKGVNTNAIAGMLDTKASSVTDMLKKLSDKDLVTYQKYQGVTLTDKGLHSAKMIVRKHRLWEVFLVDKLGFSWDEVHEIAEELEHIKSENLINKLDAFLDFSSFLTDGLAFIGITPPGYANDNVNSLFNMIDRAISQLPEKQKVVFMLRYYEGYDYEKIASIVGTTIGGAKANYHQAVKKVEGFIKQL